LKLIKVFNSQFIEGYQDKSGDMHDDTTIYRRIVNIKEDFRTFFQILYYIYTGSIEFDTHPSTSPSQHNEEEYQFPLDATTIYAAADRYLLADLKSKAFEFLESTCDVKNITGRVFGDTAELYLEIDEMYSAFFIAHSAEIIKTVEYEKFCEELEALDDEDRKLEVNSKLRQLAEDKLEKAPEKKQREQTKLRYK
jgi:hypothetical protein